MFIGSWAFHFSGRIGFPLGCIHMYIIWKMENGKLHPQNPKMSKLRTTNAFSTTFIRFGISDIPTDAKWNEFELFLVTGEILSIVSGFILKMSPSHPWWKLLQFTNIWNKLCSACHVPSAFWPFSYAGWAIPYSFYVIAISMCWCISCRTTELRTPYNRNCFNPFHYFQLMSGPLTDLILRRKKHFSFLSVFDYLFLLLLFFASSNIVQLHNGAENRCMFACSGDYLEFKFHLKQTPEPNTVVLCELFGQWFWSF